MAWRRVGALVAARGWGLGRVNRAQQKSRIRRATTRIPTPLTQLHPHPYTNHGGVEKTYPGKGLRSLFTLLFTFVIGYVFARLTLFPYSRCQLPLV